VIAAATNNAQGIAGIALPAQLIVAKVVRADRTISLQAEANAIRWAVDNGARVINLSLGGLRDPRNPQRDTFSPVEAAAVDYAYGHGAVLVAAVGNGDQAPSSPWPYASYPAALPHVIGVSALARDGSVPDFSDRDAIYNDIAAPGQDIFSIFPRQLTQLRPTCVNQGYSDCGPDDYRHAEGTSFAAPQVSAAAALLLAIDPKLTPDQVAALLEHSAVDANASNGCRRCPLLRDSLTGWGRLDIANAVAALNGPLPAPDRYETNDDAGDRAPKLWGRVKHLRATIDFWDDQTDVYRIKLTAGQRFSATVKGPAGTNTNLVLWKPGTPTVESLSLELLQLRAAQAAGPGAAKRLRYRAPHTGWYYLEVKLATPGFGPYTLSYSKR
jgi:subtilisin family serine protease